MFMNTYYLPWKSGGRPLPYPPLPPTTPPHLWPHALHADYISESQAELKDTPTSITLHLAMELGPIFRTSQKFNPQNTELSVILA